MSTEAVDAVSQAVPVSPKRKLVNIICIASALSTISLTTPGPFYTGEALARNPTGGPAYHTAVGAVYSIFMISGIAISPLIIWDLPNVGSKPLLVLALAADGGSQILFAFIDRIPNWRIFLAYSYCFRAIQGAAYTSATLASMTHLTKLYPTSLGFVNGFYAIFVGIGHESGILLGGGLYDLSGFEAPFLATGAMMLASSITIAMLMSSDTDKVADARAGGDAKAEEKHVAVATILRVPWIWLMMLALLLTNVAYSALAALLAHNMKKEFRVSSIMFSAAFSIKVGINLVTAPITGMLQDRGWNSRLLLIIGAVLSGISCLLVGPAEFLHLPKSLWLVFVAMVPLGIGHSLMFVPSVCYMYEHCGRIGLGNAVELRVAVAGVSRITLSTGYAAGPLLLSPLVAIMGFSKAFAILSFAFFATAVLIAVFYFVHKASVAARCYEGSHSDGADDMELRPLKP